MWKTTGDVRWRERAWDIFQAIEREAKTPSGYAVVKSVSQSPAPLSDDMPRFVHNFLSLRVPKMNGLCL